MTYASLPLKDHFATLQVKGISEDEEQQFIVEGTTDFE